MRWYCKRETLFKTFTKLYESIRRIIVLIFSCLHDTSQRCEQLMIPCVRTIALSHTLGCLTHRHFAVVPEGLLNLKCCALPYDIPSYSPPLFYQSYLRQLCLLSLSSHQRSTRRLRCHRKLLRQERHREIELD